MSKYDEITTKKARQEYLRKMIGKYDNWAIRALMRIYERQTADEQATHTTRNINHIGFTGADAGILTSFAQQYQDRGSLSPKQIRICRDKMRKYARQLDDIAQAEKIVA